MVRSPLRKLKKSPRSPFGPQSGGGVIAVLTLVEDGLEEASPFYTFSSTAAGTLRWDFHISATPPTAGAGSITTGTQAISAGATIFTVDLSAYPAGRGYLHFRVGGSNILTSQEITVPGTNIVNTVAPVISGVNAVGETLTATDGTWTGTPTPTFTYQWYRSGSIPIVGATSNTYVVVLADDGLPVKCTVTAGNYHFVSVDSNSITIGVSGPTDGLLQEDGAFFRLQEDGSYRTQESA